MTGSHQAPHSDAIADGVPGADFVVVSPAAHVPTVEIPDQITELLRSHLEAARHTQNTQNTRPQ